MFCIKCFNKDTQVTNSRPHKKQPSVWRRRYCPACGQIFTTDERPRLTASQKVWNHLSSESQPFNPGILTISIAKAFGHDPAGGKQSAWDLMETISNMLIIEYPSALSTDDIAAVTHQVLSRYDKTAGLQYALQHNLLAPVSPRRKK
jgi:transcriptional repressor NrdR